MAKLSAASALTTPAVDDYFWVYDASDPTNLKKIAHADLCVSGSWVPSVGGTATYGGDNSGRYSRIGDQVFFEGILDINAIGTGSLTTISGLPVATSGSLPNGIISVGYWGDLSLSIVFMGGAVSGTAITLFTASAADIGLALNNVLADGSTISFSGRYTV